MLLVRWNVNKFVWISGSYSRVSRVSREWSKLWWVWVEAVGGAAICSFVSGGGVGERTSDGSKRFCKGAIFIDFPWSKATESIWKYLKVIFLHHARSFSIYVSLQTFAQVDQLQQEMDLWPHLTNMILVRHSPCFGHVTCIAGPLRILSCICCQCVCKEQKLEETTTKNQTLQDLGNPCIKYTYSVCTNRTALFYIILFLSWSCQYSVDLDVWFTIQRNQSLQKVFDGDDSARSSWMPWQQRKAKHLRTSFLTG